MLVVLSDMEQLESNLHLQPVGKVRHGCVDKHINPCCYTCSECSDFKC